ncbi:hypothetical protein KJ780_01115, partial [Candidatus Micrarchaeota archaeon]|nr:hypothetical protein [Candidatus Micrarchaeota archaeon]
MANVMKILVFSFLFLASVSHAWDDCPFGLVNDSFPGECGRYIDANKDRICDHSQEQPVETSVTQVLANKTLLSNGAEADYGPSGFYAAGHAITS